MLIYRYFKPGEECPFEIGTRDEIFWKAEKLFYDGCAKGGERDEEAERRLLTTTWDARERGGYLDTLIDKPIENRALLLLCGLYMQRLAPGNILDKAMIDRYFAGGKKIELHDVVVNIVEQLTAPVPWDSWDRGAAYDCDDYICVLQKAPRCIYDSGPVAKLLTEDQIAQYQELHRKLEFKYLYAMFFYWKKGKNPSGLESSMPAQIYTIETSIATTDPLLCGFAPGVHWNGGRLNGPATGENVAFEILKRFTNGHPERARKIGDLATGYEILRGQPFRN